MSKKKAAGKLKQHVRPDGKRLGLKVGNGEKVDLGTVLVRQRGGQITPGPGVKSGRDFTLYAVCQGIVKFGQKQGKKYVSVSEN